MGTDAGRVQRSFMLAEKSGADAPQIIGGVAWLPRVCTVDVLQRSMHFLAGYFDVFKTTIVESPGGWRFVPCAGSAASVEAVSLPLDSSESALLDWLLLHQHQVSMAWCMEAHRPLVKIIYAEQGCDGFWVGLIAHHVVMDGMSVIAFLRQLHRCIDAVLASDGATVKWPAMPSPSLFAARVQHQGDEQAWRACLQDMVGLEKECAEFRVLQRTDDKSEGHHRSAVSREWSHHFLWNAPQWDRFQTWCDAHHRSPAMVLQTVWMGVVASLHWQEAPLLINLIHHGRKHRTLFELANWYQCLPTAVPDHHYWAAPSWEVLFDAVAMNNAVAESRGFVPDDAWLDWLEQQRANNCCQVAFTFINHAPSKASGGSEVRADLSNAVPNALSLLVKRFSDRIKFEITGCELDWKFDGLLHAVESVLISMVSGAQDWSEAWRHACGSIEPQPYSPVATRWLCPSAPIIDEPRVGPVLPAVWQGVLQRLINDLNALALEPHAPIGLWLDRGWAVPIAYWATLTCGLVVVPIEKNLPRERARHMMESSGIRCLIVSHDECLDEAWLNTYHLIAVPSLVERSADAFTAPLVIEAQPAQPFSVLFTSGSTAAPKRVINSHEGMFHRIQWMCAYLQLSHQDVFLHKTPMGFDVSTWEIMCPWLVGGRLVIVPPEQHRNPQQIIQLVHEHGVTIVHFVPSFLAEVMKWDFDPAQFVSLKSVVCSGEALSQALVDAWYARFPAIALYNWYGPTEASIDVTFYRTQPGLRREWSPIGEPLPAVDLALANPLGLRQLTGFSGNLCLMGPQVCLSLSGADNTVIETHRLYRTGDRAIQDEQGLWHFLGRLDDQLKIRGQRVSCSSIEKTLAAYPAVIKAIVKPVAGELAAWLQVDDAAASSFDFDRLINHCQSLLPLAMIPTLWALIAEVPYTYSGKLNYRALPKPTPFHREKRRAHTETQRQLQQVWFTTLGLDRDDIGIQDEFFRLGGHSLKALDLLIHINHTFHTQLEVGFVYEHATIEQQAAAIEAWIEQNNLRIDHEAVMTVMDAVSTPLGGVSDQQAAMLNAERLYPGTTAFVVPFVCAFRSELSEAELVRVLHAVCRRCYVFGLTITPTDDGWVQSWSVPTTVDIRVQRAMTPEVMTQLLAPFDIPGSGLFRLVLIPQSWGAWVLAGSFHHLVVDGWTLQHLIHQIIHEVDQAAHIDGVPTDTAEPGALTEGARDGLWMHYLRYCQASHQVRAVDRAFWQTYLAGFQLSRVSFDAPDALKQQTVEPTDSVHPWSVDIVHGTAAPEQAAARLSRLRQRAREWGVTPFTLVLGTLQWCWALVTHADEVVVGAIVSGRHTRFAGAMGCLARSVVLRQPCDHRWDARYFFSRVNDSVQAVLHHSDVPWEVIESTLPAQQRPQVWLNFQDHGETHALAGVLKHSADFGVWKPHGVQPLTVFVELNADQLAVGFEYQTACFKRARVERWLDQWFTSLDQVLNNPGPMAHVHPYQGDITHLIIGQQREFIRAMAQQRTPIYGTIAACSVWPPELGQDRLRAAVMEEAGCTSWMNVRVVDMQGDDGPLVGLVPGHHTAHVFDESDHEVWTEARVLAWLDSEAWRPDRSAACSVLRRMLDGRVVWGVKADHRVVDGVGLARFFNRVIDRVNGGAALSSASLSPHIKHQPITVSARVIDGPRKPPVIDKRVISGSNFLPHYCLAPQAGVERERIKLPADFLSGLKRTARQLGVTPHLYCQALAALMITEATRTNERWWLEEVVLGNDVHHDFSLEARAVEVPGDELNPSTTLRAWVQSFKSQRKARRAQTSVMHSPVMQRLKPVVDPARQRWIFNYQSFSPVLQFAGQISEKYEWTNPLPTTVQLLFKEIDQCLEIGWIADGITIRPLNWLRCFSHLHTSIQASGRFDDPMRFCQWQAFSTAYFEPPASNFRIDTALWQAFEQGSLSKVAVKSGAHSLSLGQLLTQALRLSERVLEQGGEGSTWVIALPPGIEWMIAMVAAVLMRRPYCPLDVSYPARYVQQYSQQVPNPLILTTPEYAPLFGEANVVVFDHPWINDVDRCDAIRDLRRAFEHLRDSLIADHSTILYWLFTSGSTGEPKPAGVTHQGALNCYRWYHQTVNLNAASRVVIASSLAFDLTQKNIWTTLLAGGEIIVPDAPAVDIAALVAEIHEHGVTIINTAPSVLRALLDHASPPALSSINYVVLGGEPIGRPLLTRLNGFPWRVFNSYGPTEASDVTHYAEVSGCFEDVVGKPIAGVMQRISGLSGGRLPSGWCGELEVGGVAVGVGYWNNPQQTQARFFNDEGVRWYRTGDLMALNSAGDAVFLGRTDHQVKVNGVRIELEAIVTHLQAHDWIKEAAAMVHERRLIAFVVLNKERCSPACFAQENDRQAPYSRLNHQRVQPVLVEFLMQRLPGGWIPTQFCVLEKLPSNPRGKLDRAALLTLVQSLASEPGGQASPLAVRLAECMSAVVGEAVGVTDNFFAQGGTSITAVRVVAWIHEHLNVSIPVLDIFKFPTPDALAQRIQLHQTPWPPITRCARDPSGYPWTDVQRVIVAAQLFLNDPHVFLMPFAVRVHETLHADRLQAAFAALVAAEPVLRTRYLSPEAFDIAPVASAIQMELMVMDPLPAGADPDSDIRQRLRALLHNRQSCWSEPLGCIAWIPHAEGGYLFGYLHHLLGDYQTFHVLLERLFECYRAIDSAETPRERPVQFPEYARWLRQPDVRQAPAFLASVDYWQHQVALMQEDQRHASHGADKPYASAQQYWEMNMHGATARRVQTLARQLGVTPFVLAMSQWQRALLHGMDMTTVWMGAPNHGRHHPQTETMLGLFAALMMVPAQAPASHVSLGEWMRDYVAHWHHALEHPWVSEASLALMLRPGTGVRFWFNWVEPRNNPSTYPHLEPMVLPSDTPGVGCSVTFLPSHDEANWKVQFMFDEQKITRTRLATVWTLFEDMMARFDASQSWRLPQPAPTVHPLADLERSALTAMTSIPASPEQTQMMLSAVFHPDSAGRCMGGWVELTPQLHIPVFKMALALLQAELAEAALAMVIDASERATLEQRGEGLQPVQTLAVYRHDLAARVEQLIYRPLDKDAAAERIRHYLVVDDANRWHWVIAADHLVTDGIGMANIIRRVVEMHAQLLAGEQPELKHHRVGSYALRYDPLPPIDATSLWRVAPGLCGLESTFQRRFHTLNTLDWQRTKTVCRRVGVTPHLFFQALFAWCLMKHGDGVSNLVLFEVLDAGPVGDDTLLRNGIGFKPVVVSQDAWRSHDYFSQWLAHFKTQRKQRKGTGYIHPAELAAFENGLPGLPVRFNFQDLSLDTALDAIALRHTEYTNPIHTGVQCTVKVKRDGLEIGLLGEHIDWDMEAFLARMVQMHHQLLSGIEHVRDINMCLPQDMAYLRACLEGEKTIFAAHAYDRIFSRLTPRNDAVCYLVDDAAVWTYADVYRATYAVAEQLLAGGVRAGDAVGVFMARSVALPICMLAIASIGAHFVPVDASLPAARFITMFKTAGVQTVLVDRQKTPSLDDFSVLPIQIIAPEKISDSISPMPSHSLRRVQERPRHMATLFTSGSTGHPKGVKILWDGLSNRLWDYAQRYSIDDRDVFLIKTPQHFDVFLWELFLPLLVGAKAVLAPVNAHREIDQLTALIHRHQVTVVQFIPSLLHAGLEWMLDARMAFSSLRSVWVGGEAFTPELAAAVRRSWPHVQWVNMYGPTEASIDVFHWVVNTDASDQLAARKVLPIGRPTANVVARIVDARGCAHIPGVPGELIIGGVQVADGYTAGVESTAFRQEAGESWYRTGDTVFLDRQGQVCYLGRFDNQVKINGQRIELGEIEYQIGQLDGIKRVTVLKVDESLVAFWSGVGIDAAAIRHHCAATLSAIMVPQRFIAVEQWPVTSTGKLDRKALVAMLSDAPLSRDETKPTDAAKPLTEFERAVALAFKRVLPNTEPTQDDDFFKLGGHSLDLLSLVADLNRQLGIDIPIAEAYRQTTVQQLAVLIERLRQPETKGEQHELDMLLFSRSFEATYAQRQFWIKDIALYQDGGEFACGQNHISIAFKVKNPDIVNYLERAIDKLISLHPILSAHFSVVDDRMIAQLKPEWRPAGEVCSLVDISSEQFIDHLVRRSFVNDALSEMPAMRWGVARGHDHARVVIVMHHSIVDNHSLGILWRDLLSDEPAALRAPRPHHFIDYVNWLAQVKLLPMEPASAALTLDDVRPIKITRDQAPGLPRAVGLRRKPMCLESVDRLRRAAAEQGCSINTVITVAWLRTLSAISEQDSVCIGMPVSQRMQARWADTVGCLVQTLPLALPVRGRAFDELVRDCHAAIHHLVEHSVMLEGVAAKPLHYPVLINFVNNAYHAHHSQIIPGEIETLDVPITDSRADLVLDIVDAGDTWELALSFRRDFYSDAFIDRLVAVFYAWLDVQELASINPDVPVQRDRVNSLTSFSHTPDDLVEMMASEVAQVFAEELKLTTVKIDDDFFALGGHSLGALRVVRRIKEQVGLSVSVGAIFEVATPRGLVQRSVLDQQPRERDPFIIHRRTGDAALPTIVMLHPSIGVCRCYHTLTQSLESHHPVVWLQATSLQHPDLKTMAACYLRTLTAQGVTRMIIVGYSFGGVLGLEMAYQQPDMVEKLLMIDVSFKVPFDASETFPEFEQVAELRGALSCHRHHAALLAEHTPRCAPTVDTQLLLANQGVSNAMEWMKKINADWSVSMFDATHASIMESTQVCNAIVSEMGERV